MGLEGLRRRLYEYVQAHPGAHILEMADALQLSHPTVLYHLRILEDEGYVQSAAGGKRRCAFDTQAHFNAWEREVLMLLQSEAGRVFEYVAEHPGSFPRELAARLGISETTVKRAVPELLRLGLVAEETGFRRRLRLASSFADDVAPILARLAPGDLRMRLTAILARERARRDAETAQAEAEVAEEARNRLVP